MKEDTWRKEYPDRVCVNCGQLFSRKKMTMATAYKIQRTCSAKCKGEHLQKKLFAGILRAFEPRKCGMCKDIFQPKNQVHRYCGSKKHKTGCSFKNYLAYKKKKNSLYRMYGSRRNWMNTTKSFIR